MAKKPFPFSVCEECCTGTGGGGGSVDAYTKSETNALLNDKADKSNTYTKAEVENIHKDIVDDINTKLSSVFTYAGTGDAEIYYFIENGEWSGVVDIKHGLVFNITGNDGVDTPIIIPAQYSATGVERTLNKGDNVAVIDANYGISNTPDWKLDVLAGIENLDAYYTKTEINLKVSDLESEIQEVSDSIPEAINGKDGYTPVRGVDYWTEEDKAEIIKELPFSLTYEETRQIFIGDNVLGAPTLSEGWTSEGDAYTHAANTTADLMFATAVEKGEVYLLTFTTNYSSDEFVKVGLGEQYRVRCYQGKSTIVVPLYADKDNATLYFTPDKDGKVGFQIQNIKLCKIQESGTEQGLEIYGSATDNHTKNYGFYNTLIGHNVAENAVGSTRTIAIGKDTLRDLQGGHRNIGIGTFAMSQMKGGEENVAIGADSMLYVKQAESCVSIGMGAMSAGTSHKGDIAIGKFALTGRSNSTTEKNISIGNSSGNKVTTAKNNIFIGNNSGYNITSGLCNTFIGEGAAKNATTAYFNTVIGREGVIPAGANNCVVIGDGAVATKSKQAVIGSDAITETLLKGDLIVRGVDGIYRQIVFNADNTISWAAVEQ